MAKYIIYLAGFEYLDRVVRAVESVGGRVVKIGKFSPYIVVEMPERAMAMVSGVEGVAGIMPAPEFRTHQVEIPF